MTERVTIPCEVGALCSNIAEMLRGVEPSVSNYGSRLYPCEVITDDGVFHPRVYVVKASSYIREWGVWPWSDQGKRWVRAESICSLHSSKLRLPVRFANTLNAAGESGMGYCAFSVELRNGSRLYFVTGNAVDFPNWPPGVSPTDVIAVRAHDRSPAHGVRPPFSHESSAEYEWSPFRAPV
ncbi:MAG TPA: hypothetical protein VD971_06325 [Phycisphaerales bacterium]|nr:hypothetical protein [Phycisphaerales bacterium]